MALVLKDRVRVTSSTTGTGTFTLGSAAAGFQDFSVIGDGNTTYYTIQNSGDNTWEVGIGTYTASGTTLSRDTVLESSNSGSLVNFAAGTKDVFVTYPAEKGLYLDASNNAIGLGTPASATLTNATGLPLTTGVTGTLQVANGGTGVTTSTGTGNVVLSTSPTLTTPLLGTPTSGTLTNCTGLPISTGVSGLGTGVATFLGTPSSSNLASAVTDETGSGSLVFATSPTLVTPALGTPSSGTLTSCTGLPLTTGVTGTLPVTNGGTGTATSFTTGSVVFAGASGVYSQDNANLFWDDTNNRLGIGTAAPATRITINNNTVLPSAGAPSTTSSIWTVGGDSVASGLSFDSFAIQTNFITRRANGTAASPTALATGNNIFQFAARGYGATGYSTSGRAQFAFIAGENWTDTAQGAYITFTTTANTTTTTTEKMRIDDAGNVGIGTTSPTYKTQINSNGAQLRLDNSSGGQFTEIQWANATVSKANAYWDQTGTAFQFGTDVAAPLILKTNTTERMRIDSSGNVIVGTTSSFQSLITSAANNATGSNLYDAANLNSGNNTTKFARYSFSGVDTVGTRKATAYIDCGPAEANYVGSYLAFSTRASDAVAERMRITSDGLLQFNSGYGSVATAYGCRAWVNFDGTSNTANLTGTYSQSGTTVTVTVTNHGLIAGSVIFADATTGTAVDGTYTVATVTSANVFTYTAGTSLTTSGNMTLRRNTIRGSGNVTSITDNGTGDYTVNFTTAMPDVNYAPFTSARSYQDNDDNGIFTFPFLNHTNTTSAFRFIVAHKDAGSSGGNTPFDSTQVNVSVFR